MGRGAFESDAKPAFEGVDPTRWHSAMSRLVRASGPSVASVPPLPRTPVSLIVPRVGRSPKTPQSDAGSRIDPRPSLPIVIGTMPAATAAADPPDDPPGVREGSC